jgi:hypothetical protein
MLESSEQLAWLRCGGNLLPLFSLVCFTFWQGPLPACQRQLDQQQHSGTEKDTGQGQYFWLLLAACPLILVAAGAAFPAGLQFALTLAAQGWDFRGCNIK